MQHPLRARGFTPFRSRRVALSWIISGISLGVLVGLLVASRGSEREGFAYTEIEPPQPARDFTLENHRGGTFVLSEHRGRPVVLTFLYTSCTDVCPFVGHKLRQTMELLGSDASEVTLAAVSVDPARDTPERAEAYSRSLGLHDRWHYLIGAEDELEPVWEAYFIGPSVGGEAHVPHEDELEEHGITEGLDDEGIRRANETRHSFGGGYDVSHSAPVWLIDARGRIRASAGHSFEPGLLASDIRHLTELAK